jgi:AraC family cel operon transcriptional repressor
MVIHLRAQDIIDPETEAHYSFKTIRPAESSHGRISTTCHDHDFFELFLINHGQIWHRVNQVKQLIVTGTLVFIRPSDRHSFHQFEAEDCGLINLAFPVQTVGMLFEYFGEGFNSARLIDPDLPPIALLDEQDRQAAVAQLTRLNSIPHTEKRRIRAQLRLLLANFIGQYFSEDTDGIKTTESNDWLQKLCAQMQNPANLRGGVQRMQTLAHTSPEHLSRTCRRLLGCTPTQYINNLRLTYAANLLLHTDRPIVDVCYEVGLDNLSYFYRIFKQRYGITPAQFRTQYRKRLIP